MLTFVRQAVGGDAGPAFSKLDPLYLNSSAPSTEEVTGSLLRISVGRQRARPENHQRIEVMDGCVVDLGPVLDSVATLKTASNLRQFSARPRMLTKERSMSKTNRPVLHSKFVRFRISRTRANRNSCTIRTNGCDKNNNNR